MSSTTLTQLAAECADVFNELPSVFYSATKSVKLGGETKKIRATGRFVNRINYMRILLVDDGLLEKKTLVHDDETGTQGNPETCSSYRT